MTRHSRETDAKLVEMNADEAGRPGYERRREPRLPLDAEVTVRAREGSVSGRTRDVSSMGMLIELNGPLPSLSTQLEVELALGDEPVVVLADVVRRSIAESGRVMLALKIAESAPGTRLLRAPRRAASSGPPRRRRASRAKPREPRAAEQVLHELRAVGARVLELALLEPDAGASASMAEWVVGLGRELRLEPDAAPETNRQLLCAIADLHRRASGPAAA